MSPDSPQPAVRPPHPLALELIERLRSRPGAIVLEIGRGSGRNTRALEAAGFTVVDPGAQTAAAAALSTHALLHGTPASIAELLSTVAQLVEPNGAFYATFGSVRDARFGQGVALAENVFAPEAGDESGVAHTYFTEDALRGMLERSWAIESLEEVGVDEIAGSWAHRERPLAAAVHWFLRARRR